MTTVLIIAFLLAIIASLGAGLYFLMTEREAESRKVFYALSWRVGLQALLIIFLAVAFFAGWIEPHGSPLD
ncbi:MAG: hypothetical protein CMN28_14025 [Salinisphaeraceae bacterium]|jgi:drug/metabolite transporter (DMT)-like permease|nr:hypothetical protein [Salinisphaeraceae bacterium]